MRLSSCSGLADSQHVITGSALGTYGRQTVILIRVISLP